MEEKGITFFSLVPGWCEPQFYLNVLKKKQLQISAQNIQGVVCQFYFVQIVSQIGEINCLVRLYYFE